MILFYSEFCQHCTILLETIKRHDKNKIVKLVSVDLLRNLKKPIDPKIDSVPALLLLNGGGAGNKEYLFGKAVFDYLLLPNRGVLFSGQTTRDDKRTSRPSDTMGATVATPASPDEPMAFTLGAISAEQFASIDDGNDNMISDKNYNWDRIDNDNASMASTVITGLTADSGGPDEGKKNKLPTMEEIMKQRASDIM